MTHPLILLGVELPSRELLPYKILAKTLQRRGYRTEICGLPELNHKIRTLQPDAVVDNVSWRNDHFYPYYYGLRQIDFRLINMVWEQIIEPHWQHIFRFKDGFHDHYIDHRVAWGQGFKQYAMAQGVPDERITITGAPKQAALRIAQQHIPHDTIVRSLFGAEVVGRQIVLFATNFSYAFLSPAKLKWLIDMGMQTTIGAWGRAYNQFYCQIIPEIARLYPDMLFVVRPHPAKEAEYAQSYKQAVANLPNVRVVETGDFTWLLLASSVLVTTRSTTSVDAYFMGIPTLQLMQPDNPYDTLLDYQSSFDYFVRMVTPDDICQHLPEYFSAPYFEAPRLASRWANHWMNDAPVTTFDNIADMIETTLQRPRVAWKNAPRIEWTWQRKRAKQKIVPSVLELEPLGQQLIDAL